MAHIRHLTFELVADLNRVFYAQYQHLESRVSDDRYIWSPDDIISCTVFVTFNNYSHTHTHTQMKCLTIHRQSCQVNLKMKKWGNKNFQ